VRAIEAPVSRTRAIFSTGKVHTDVFDYIEQFYDLTT
jgi:hypothetical protein